MFLLQKIQKLFKKKKEKEKDLNSNRNSNDDYLLKRLALDRIENATEIHWIHIGKWIQGLKLEKEKKTPQKTTL